MPITSLSFVNTRSEPYYRELSARLPKDKREKIINKIKTKEYNFEIMVGNKNLDDIFLGFNIYKINKKNPDFVILKMSCVSNLKFSSDEHYKIQLLKHLVEKQAGKTVCHFEPSTDEGNWIQRSLYVYGQNIEEKLIINKIGTMKYRFDKSSKTFESDWLCDAQKSEKFEALVRDKLERIKASELKKINLTQ